MTKRATPPAKTSPSGQAIDAPPVPDGGRLIEPRADARREPDIDDPPADALGPNVHGLGPDTDGGPNPDYKPETDAAAMSDTELDAQIAADLAAGDAEIAAADAAALAPVNEEPAAPPSSKLYVRLYVKDARDRTAGGALVAPTAPTYHELGGPYPRMLTVAGITYERAGVDADGFETYRQPDF